MEFIERKVIQLGEDYLKMSFPEPEASAYVLTTLDGSRNEINDHLEGLRKVAKESGALSVLPLEDKEEAARVWKIRGMLVKGVELFQSRSRWISLCRLTRFDAFCNLSTPLKKNVVCA